MGKRYMKYIISENRLISLIDRFVHHVFPHFNSEDTEVLTWSNGDETYLEYFDREKDGRPFAKYYVWKNELVLHHDLFDKLESYLGKDHMEFIIDWFNNEFNQDAEYISF